MKQTARAVLLNRNNKCLFVQHNEWNPADQGKWSTVGGRIEDGETQDACLSRELIEEFGTSIKEKFKIGPKLHENKQKDRTDHFYIVWFEDEDVKIESTEEIKIHSWFSIEDLNDLNLFFGIEKDLYIKAQGIPRPLLLS